MGVLKGVVGSLMAGVQNLIPESSDLPLTRFVESVFMKNSENTVLNPKQQKGLKSNSNWNENEIDEVVVFFVGGLTYQEYNNLVTFFTKKYPNIKVHVGATEVLNGNFFLSQLEKMQ